MNEEKHKLLLKDLKDIGINAKNYQVLSLLPLVFVAWADGKIQKGEYVEIMKIAKERHYLHKGGEKLLAHWLNEEPTPSYYEKGFRALVELARSEDTIGEDITPKNLKELLDMCMDVAKSAGGLWGKLWSVAPEEEVAIAKIASALAIDDGESWGELLEDLSSEPS